MYLELFFNSLVLFHLLIKKSVKLSIIIFILKNK